MDPREVRRLDLNAEELGVSVAKLMARAGQGLAKHVLPFRKDGFVLFLCGKGNNGGDGYAAACLLERQNIPVQVVEVEAPRSIPSRSYHAQLQGETVAWDSELRKDWAKADVIVDCLLGSGAEGEPRGVYRDIIDWLRRVKTPVVACDVPSGWQSKRGVKATLTVSFVAAKDGVDGEVVVVPLELPREASNVGRGDLQVYCPKPHSQGHKGSHGKVLIIGGGPYHGAPHYAGMAAYRMGADLVRVWTPQECARVMQTWGPELMIGSSNPGDHLTHAKPDLSWPDALVIGPGLGTHKETLQAVEAIIDKAVASMPVVIDADAISKRWAHCENVVYTPHHAECKRAFGSAKPAVVDKHDATILLKGATDVIGNKQAHRMCTRGHPTMTVGGTGDILAGAVGALLARGVAPFEAACAAAYTVGVAGEQAAHRHGMGAGPLHILDEMGDVLARNLL